VQAISLDIGQYAVLFMSADVLQKLGSDRPRSRIGASADCRHADYGGGRSSVWPVGRVLAAQMGSFASP